MCTCVPIFRLYWVFIGLCRGFKWQRNEPQPPFSKYLYIFINFCWNNDHLFEVHFLIFSKPFLFWSFSICKVCFMFFHFCFLSFSSRFCCVIYYNEFEPTLMFFKIRVLWDITKLSEKFNDVIIIYLVFGECVCDFLTYFFVCS